VPTTLLATATKRAMVMVTTRVMATAMRVVANKDGYATHIYFNICKPSFGFI
jgi:hypothetical protein